MTSQVESGGFYAQYILTPEQDNRKVEIDKIWTKDVRCLGPYLGKEVDWIDWNKINEFLL